MGPNVDRPESIANDELGLELVFPLAKGVEWCPGLLKKQEAGPNGTLTPCQFEGKRVVQAELSYQSPVGNYDRCYQTADIYNSGGAIQTFCEGVGMVEIRYDHPGTRYGWSYVLQSMTRGGESSNTKDPEPSATTSALAELVPLGAQIPENLSMDLYRLKQPVSYGAAEEYGYDQVQAHLSAPGHWGTPGFKAEWQARLDAANAALAAFNYRLVGVYAPPTSTEYTLFLDDQVILTGIESFSDVSVNKGITDFVMAVQVTSQDGKLIRNGSITSWTTVEGWLHRSQPQYMGYDLLYADMESVDGRQNVKVTVYRNTREMIYTTTIQAKAPIPGLVNLWTFSDPWVDHWALEVADSVVIDGQPVNEQHDYQKSYEFHLIGGKPFYFFERAGKVSANYDGHEIALDGSEIPHYNCCSPGLLNPRQKNDTLIFFMNKDQSLVLRGGVSPRSRNACSDRYVAP